MGSFDAEAWEDTIEVDSREAGLMPVALGAGKAGGCVVDDSVGFASTSRDVDDLTHDESAKVFAKMSAQSENLSIGLIG